MRLCPMKNCALCALIITTVLYAAGFSGLVARAEAPAAMAPRCQFVAPGQCACLTYDPPQPGPYSAVEEGLIRLKGYDSNQLAPGDPGDYLLAPRATDKPVFLPLLAIRTPGEYATVEKRTIGVAQNIVHAFDMLELDPKSTLDVLPAGTRGAPAVWVTSPQFKHRFPVITITEEDAARMPKAGADKPPSANAAAQYVRSILEGYHELFLMYRSPAGSQVAKTDQGAILTNIFREARRIASDQGRQNPQKSDIISVIKEMAEPQKTRLYNLPLIIPADWPEFK